MNKKIKNLFIALTILGSSIICINTNAEGGGSTADQLLSGWQQFHCRSKKLYMDKVHVEFGFNLNSGDKIGLKFNVDTYVSLVDCCTGCDNEYSWCDFDEQNEHC